MRVRRFDFLTLLAMLAALPLTAGTAYDVLVQGAVDGELQPLIAALAHKREVRHGAWTFWTGQIAGRNVVVSRTDMGPINAVGATMMGIEKFHPKLIVNQGTAGAHNPDLKLWDIVVGEHTVDYSAYRSAHGDAGSGTKLERWTPMVHKIRPQRGELRDYKVFDGDPAAIEAAVKVKYSRAGVVKGTIGSAYQYNRELDTITWLRKTYGTDSEDMESAYVAGAAAAMGVRFVAIRIISDSEWNHPVFERIAGQYCAEFVVEFLRSGFRP